MNKVKGLNGRMTIETTLIMPVIITIVILFSYLWLYLYNIYVTHEAVDSYLIHYEEEWIEDAYLEYQICEGLYKELENKLLGIDITSVRVVVEPSRIEVETDWIMKFRLGDWIKNYIDSEFGHKIYISEIKRDNFMKIVRNYRMIEGVIK